MTDPFEEITARGAPSIQNLARQARALIYDVYPGVVEVPWPRQGIAGYGVGPKKMSEQFCYIAVFKNHLNLGFYYGAELPDPSNLLEGAGELLRHVKIRTPGQLADPALRQLIEAAARHLPRLKTEGK